MKLDVIYNEDCIGEKGIKILPDKSIDMILADMPYGTTACKWDTIISLEPLWKQVKRIIKPNGAIVLMASQPFISKLVMSNLKMFKYEWIWEKGRGTNFMLSKKQPLKNHETICVFYNKQPTYNPIMVRKSEENRKRAKRHRSDTEVDSDHYKNRIKIEWGSYKNDYGFPKTVQFFKMEASNQYKKNLFHPTQKPVALMEYLIKTYTNEGEIVLDFAIGSGTTAMACIHLKRYYIGFETSKEYCQIAEQRLEAEKTLWDYKEKK